MSQNPPVIIMVGADKGGVGKTTVARALVDYLVARGVKSRVIDTQSPLGDLVKFVPDAEVLDLDKTSAQMKVFDAPAGVTLVDVRGGLLSPLIRALDEVRMLEDVKAGAVRLVLLHVIGPSAASLLEIAETMQQLGGARYLVVRNHINEDTFAEWDADQRFAALFERLKGQTITVPHLVADAASAVQRAEVGFAAFASDPSASRILRGKVAAWLARTFPEFERLMLGELVLPTGAEA